MLTGSGWDGEGKKDRTERKLVGGGGAPGTWHRGSDEQGAAGWVRREGHLGSSPGYRRGAARQKMWGTARKDPAAAGLNPGTQEASLASIKTFSWLRNAKC